MRESGPGPVSDNIIVAGGADGLENKKKKIKDNKMFCKIVKEDYL